MKTNEKPSKSGEKDEKKTDVTPIEELIVRDGSALGAIFVIGNLLDRLRETYIHVNRVYPETIDAMRKLTESLRKSIAMDLTMEIKHAK